MSSATERCSVEIYGSRCYHMRGKITVKSLSGDGCCRPKHRVTELRGRQTEINFFVLFRVALLVLRSPSPCWRKKPSVNLSWYVKFSRSERRVLVYKKLFRACLDTCLRLSSINEVVSRCCKLRKTGE